MRPAGPRTPESIHMMAEQWQQPKQQFSTVPTYLGQNQKAPMASMIKLMPMIRTHTALYIQMIVQDVPVL